MITDQDLPSIRQGKNFFGIVFKPWIEVMENDAVELAEIGLNEPLQVLWEKIHDKARD